MLILTRRIGERVMVGDQVALTILEIRGDRVRLGIVAPGSTSVHREEVYLELLAANQRAASPADEALNRLRNSTIRSESSETA